MNLADVAASHLTQACSLLTPEHASDGAGGQVTTYATEDTVCRVAVASGGTNVEQVLGDRLKGRVPYRYTLPHGTAVSTGHRIGIDGTVFEVLTSEVNETVVRGICAVVA